MFRVKLAAAREACRAFVRTVAPDRAVAPAEQPRLERIRAEALRRFADCTRDAVAAMLSAAHRGDPLAQRWIDAFVDG